MLLTCCMLCGVILFFPSYRFVNVEITPDIETGQHLKFDVTMCPVWFMPLYELVKLYDAIDRKDESLALVKIIIDKDVKASSSTVFAIKNEMRQLIKALEMSDLPVNNTQTIEEPKIDKTWQGEMPEYGIALPP